MAIKAALFDAYGTLLDIGSATTRLVASQTHPELADKADKLTEIWRAKQLHYSWLRSLMGDYCSFWQVTEDGLDYALEATGLDGNAGLRADLLDLYKKISAYEDAAPILKALRQDGIACAILSNGNLSMLHEAVSHAGLDSHLDKLLSVEALRIFKTAPQTYQMGCDAYQAQPDEILFFSSNGWDIAGASYFGYQTIWVNRLGLPQERLPSAPHHIVTDLHQATALAREICAG